MIDSTFPQLTDCHQDALTAMIMPPQDAGEVAHRFPRLRSFAHGSRNFTHRWIR
jgi:hypothetical protein